MKVKWKDVYNSNKKRRYCDITGIKKEDVELESDSFRALKEKKYFILALTIIIIALLLYTFRNDIKVFFMVLAFFSIAGICFFVFNYFKLKCTKEGLYVKFGMQEGVFKYDRLKSVYLSRFNDYSLINPTKGYNIVIRYLDNYNRIKELSFANYFLKPEEVMAFLENLEIEAVENNSYVGYERFKLLKKIGKIAIFVLFALLILGNIFLRG